MRSSKIALSMAALLAASAVGLAQIERLDLEQMVDRVDNAVYGAITSKQAYRVIDPQDGTEVYYTAMTIEGRSLIDGSKLTVDVTYLGGWINEEEGVWNSESPVEEDTEVGKRVVAFYKWFDNIGGGVSANRLYALHGGLYRTVEGPKGTVVLGRGEGLAVSKNIRLEDLDRAVTNIRAARDKK